MVPSVSRGTALIDSLALGWTKGWLTNADDGRTKSEPGTKTIASSLIAT